MSRYFDVLTELIPNLQREFPEIAYNFFSTHTQILESLLISVNILVSILTTNQIYWDDDRTHE